MMRESLFISVICVSLAGCVSAQENVTAATAPATQEAAPGKQEAALAPQAAVPAQEAAAPAQKLSSGELVVKCWEVHGKKDHEATSKHTQHLIDLYQEEAKTQQASLKKLPKSKDEIMAAQALNDVATAFFIQGESFRDQGKNQEAINAFRVVVEK